MPLYLKTTLLSIFHVFLQSPEMCYGINRKEGRDPDVTSNEMWQLGRDMKTQCISGMAIRVDLIEYYYEYK